jgi:hypothetical protein
VTLRHISDVLDSLGLPHGDADSLATRMTAAALRRAALRAAEAQGEERGPLDECAHAQPRALLSRSTGVDSHARIGDEGETDKVKQPA